MSLWKKHAIFEKNSILLVIGILIVIAIGGLVEIVPLFYLEEHDREGRGRAALHAARACRPQHLRARGLLHLPLADDPPAARRGRALRPLLARRREHVRPSVPVGVEAHRARPRARRRQIFRRLASRSSAGRRSPWCRDRSCRPIRGSPQTDLDLAHIDDDLRVQATLGVPYTAEMIANAQADVEGASRRGRRCGGSRQALSEGRGARLRRQARTHHRSRRADRLPADARHARRLQALRR